MKLNKLLSPFFLNMSCWSFSLLVLVHVIRLSYTDDYSDAETMRRHRLICEKLNLPEKHAQTYFNAHPEIAAFCKKDGQNCPYHRLFDENSTEWQSLRWGYEPDADKPGMKRFFTPTCSGSFNGFAKDKRTQEDTFFTQADFGYVRQQIRELKVICEPIFIDDSSLECSKNMRFCVGRNLMVDFRDLNAKQEPIRYDLNVLKQGQIGGFCKLHEGRFKSQLDHLSALQSWAPELRFFEELRQRPIVEGECDVVVEKPTIFMKIDASVNMYHHFCDFFNLYASLHINSTYPGFYGTDVNILIWETFLYHSSFSETFDAFTENKLMDLTTFQGKRVCFKNLMFPLLPRMIFGLYYNTPLIPGCEKSGMFRAFSEFILHRLKVPQHQEPKRIRLTFLSRNTKYRKVLNEADLIRAIEKIPNLEVQQVSYSGLMAFKDQLEITGNTDIFVGIHGAGLAHLLFLPNWATLFELYNCEDSACYRDLSRLRGVNYMTWENRTLVFPEDQGHHPDGGGAHAKFTNYEFDEKEFVRLVKKAIAQVEEHPEYQQYVTGNNDQEDHDEL